MRYIPGNAAGDSETFGFHLEVWQRRSEQALFATEISPVSLCQGRVRTRDVVAVLLGCSHPHILRPEGDQFCFVGRAFVGVVMQGEAWVNDVYKSRIISIV